MKPRYPLFVYCALSVLLGLYSFYRSHGAKFTGSYYLDWQSLTTVVLTVSAFIFILNLPMDRLSLPLLRLLRKLSGLCFGAYLVSWIFDSLFYPRLNTAVPVMQLRMKWFFLIVPANVILSLALSWLLSLLQRALTAGFRILRKAV